MKRDQDGEYTYVGYRDNMVIDYVMTNEGIRKKRQEIYDKRQGGLGSHAAVALHGRRRGEEEDKGREKKQKVKEIIA